MKIFFDTEFTGLHQGTTLVSLGMVSEDGRDFYAEFTDYDLSQVDEWLQHNVIDQLYLSSPNEIATNSRRNQYRGPRWAAKPYIQHWLEKFDTVEMWGDVLAYDWVLFCELFGGAQALPENVHYIPRDIATVLEVKGFDPDISRSEFAGMTPFREHNALDDAYVIKGCYLTLFGAGYRKVKGASE